MQLTAAAVRPNLQASCLASQRIGVMRNQQAAAWIANAHANASDSAPLPPAPPRLPDPAALPAALPACRARTAGRCELRACSKREQYCGRGSPATLAGLLRRHGWHATCSQRYAQLYAQLPAHERLDHSLCHPLLIVVLPGVPQLVFKPRLLQGCAQGWQRAAQSQREGQGPTGLRLSRARAKACGEHATPWLSNQNLPPKVEWRLAIAPNPLSSSVLKTYTHFQQQVLRPLNKKTGGSPTLRGAWPLARFSCRSRFTSAAAHEDQMREQVGGYTAKLRQLLVQQPVHVGGCKKTNGGAVVGQAGSWTCLRLDAAQSAAHEASKAPTHAEQPKPPENTHLCTAMLSCTALLQHHTPA